MLEAVAKAPDANLLRLEIHKKLGANRALQRLQLPHDKKDMTLQELHAKQSDTKAFLHDTVDWFGKMMLGMIELIIFLKDPKAFIPTMNDTTRS